MLILEENGYRPEEIRIIEDWKVLAACAAVHLGTLAYVAWRVGTVLAGFYP